MSQPNSVCFLKRQLGQLGGLEKYTRLLAKAFASLGHYVTILSESDPKLEEGIRVEKVHRPSFCSSQNILNFDKACQKWLKQNPCDIVFGVDRTSKQTHIRAGNGVHRAFLEQRKKADPWLKRHTYWCNRANRVILDIEKRSFEDRKLKILFTNSHMVKNEILTYYKTDPAKIFVVHNGVEHEALEPHFLASEVLKEKLGLHSDVHQLLFIGNGYQRKGLIPLLLALGKLSHLPFHLTVIGKEKNIGFYQKKAAALGISHKVSFLGSQKGTTAYYAAADTLVVPSYYDPFANVTVEAMAMGVFVISSPYNGGSEIITDINGITLPSLDISAFTSILEKRIEERKTKSVATQIRESVAHLDFRIQLAKITNASLLS